MARRRGIGYRVVTASLSFGVAMAAYEVFTTSELNFFRLMLVVGAFAALLTVVIVVLGEADDYYWS